MKTLVKIPSLKVIADDAAATKLRELLKDADDGLRRVVRCGLYIEWIAANLPHGQLTEWLEANCPDVGHMTVHRWRTMAKNVCEWAGFKFTQWGNLPASQTMLLDCPVEQLPKQVQAARRKMDELLDSAKTPKQLFFDMGFKQGELDAHGYPRAKRGQMKGSKGLTKEMRDKAQQVTQAEKLVALKLWMETAGKKITAECHLAGFGQVDETPGGGKVLEVFTDVIADAHSFLQNLKKSRGGK